MKIRLATNEDSDGIIRLIDSVLQEWEDRVCLDDSESDLLDIEQHYFAQGGVFIVLEDKSQILGTHAVLPLSEPSVCSFKRLYLAKSLRGSSWGSALMDWTIDWARQQGFQRIEFWSDSRFHRAHRFFARFGFQKSGEVRTMHDSFDPYDEFHFFRSLVGPETSGTSH